MSKITAAKAREQFSEVLNQTAYGKERIVLTRSGKDIVAIVPMDDLRLLEKLEDHLDLEDAKKALEDTKKNGTIPWKKIKRDLGL